MIRFFHQNLVFVDHLYIEIIKYFCPNKHLNKCNRNYCASSIRIFLLRMIFSILNFFSLFKKPNRNEIIYSTEYFYSTQNISNSMTIQYQNDFFINIGQILTHSGGIVCLSHGNIAVLDSFFVQCKSFNQGGAIEVFDSQLKIFNTVFDRCFLFNEQSTPGGISIYFSGFSYHFDFNLSTVKSFNSNAGQSELVIHANLANFDSLNYVSSINMGNSFLNGVANTINIVNSNLSNVNYPESSASFIFSEQFPEFEFSLSVKNCFFQNLKTQDNNASVFVVYGICDCVLETVSFVDCGLYSISLHDSKSKLTMNDFCFSNNRDEGITGEFVSNFFSGTFNDNFCDRNRILSFQELWSIKHTIILCSVFGIFAIVFIAAFILHILLMQQFRETFHGWQKNDAEGSD
ncbi:hypothetical protein TRFO_17464 [Tritrichomonas foetus]|uniref:Transmembrane protein n=1 Tax=Tritrichomonas foetus TaxID=1144522 RepID=A0A1J4KN34_9EUKA|nr:hypothetical protein TRFO_17464 [Tritrichomonas foetus]|eukprot:OHT12643.1 hypothetical protein TRFO_17464 [Tritrichomonas foetus]